MRLETTGVTRAEVRESKLFYLNRDRKWWRCALTQVYRGCCRRYDFKLVSIDEPFLCSQGRNWRVATVSANESTRRLVPVWVKQVTAIAAAALSQQPRLDLPRERTSLTRLVEQPAQLHARGTFPGRQAQPRWRQSGRLWLGAAGGTHNGEPRQRRAQRAERLA